MGSSSLPATNPTGQPSPAGSVPAPASALPGVATAAAVPGMSPGAAALPCPLEMRLLAPPQAVFMDDSVPTDVTVSLTVQNIAQPPGHVVFYFTVDSSEDLLWLGCERSEIIRLAPSASHEVTLRACFVAPGVFDLNRFQFFVVAAPSRPGCGVIASEQNPVAFTLPLQRLICVADSEEEVSRKVT